MTFCSFRLVFVLLESSLMFCHFCDSIQEGYVRQVTGLHPHLSGHILRQSTTRSKLECGIQCQSMSCASLRFDATTRECIQYDVFMSYTSSVNEIFYTVPDTQDAAALICPTPRTYNSSFVNVALGKIVTVSSQYSADSTGSLAVDGSLNNIWPCACTQYSQHPYLNVDLGQNFKIFSIYILNRWDCCDFRLHHLKVKVGETMTHLQDVFYQEHAIGCDVTIFLPNFTDARYVNLVIESTEILTVCELEVYAVM